MKFETLRKLELKYTDYLKSFPLFEKTQIKMNERKEYVLCVHYKKGLSISEKKEIATELGDIPMKWIQENV